jgi:NitT/TauT family transport system permease protein
VVFYILFLIAWYLLAHSGLWKSYLFADPLEVWNSLLAGFGSGPFLHAIIVSLSRLAIGYGISLVLGIILGLAIGLNRYVEETLGSLVLGFQALPSVCWTPFALLWFGLSEQAMTFVVIMGALFSITLGVDAGVKNTPPVYLKAARNMGARGFAMVWQVVLPAALPMMISGLKQGWSFAWRSLMAAELIYQSISLGYLLQSGRDTSDVPAMFAVMLIIIVLGITINGVIFDPLERTVRRRWGLLR